MPIDLPRGLFALLLFTVLAAPAALGGVDPWVWSAQGLLAGLMLLAWAVHVAVGHRAPVAVRRIAVPATLFAAALAWAVVQASGATPAAWHHPLWQLAGDRIGRADIGAISLNPAETWNTVFRFAFYAAVFYLALNLCRDRGRARLLVEAVALAVTLYAAYGLAAHLSGAERILWMEKTSYRGDLTSTFVNRNTFAAFAGLGLVCLVGLLFDGMRKAAGGELRGELPRRERRRRLGEFLAARGALLIGGIFFTLTAILLTHSRAGLASTLAAVAVLILMLGFTGFLAVRRSIVTIGVAAAVLFALLAAGGAGTLTRLLEIGDHAETRFELYRRTIDATADSPWLGTGLGAFADTFRLYRTQQIEHPFGEAHDTYLENVMELGIPAGAALILSVASLTAICAIGLVRRRRGRMLPAVGIAASVLVGLHAVVDFSLQNPAVAALYFMLMGAACAQSWSSRIDTSR